MDHLLKEEQDLRHQELEGVPKIHIESLKPLICQLILQWFQVVLEKCHLKITLEA